MNYDMNNNATRFTAEHPAAWAFDFVNGASASPLPPEPAPVPAGDLIHITATEDGQQTVNARELHRFLESKQDFSDWIKNRIANYKFAEERDFTRFTINLGKTSGGRPAIEYLLTVEMAMALSMVENNTKGEQARAFFIDCKKRVDTARILLEEARSAPPFDIFNDVQKSYLEILRTQISLGIKPDIAARAALRLTLPVTAARERQKPATAYQSGITAEKTRELLDLMQPETIYTAEQLASALPTRHYLRLARPAAQRSYIGNILKPAILEGRVLKIHPRGPQRHITYQIASCEDRGVPTP